jgi:hypothetical protein
MRNPRCLPRLLVSRRMLAAVFALSILGATGCGSGGEVEDAMDPESHSAGLSVEAGSFVYRDALAAGWEDWSWATHSLASTTPVSDGRRSISATLGAWTGLYFHHAGFSTRGLTHFIFRVHGGSAYAGARILARAVVNGTWTTGVDINAYCGSGRILARQWVTCRVPVSVLGASNQVITGVSFQEAAGRSFTSAFYLDELGWLAPLADAGTPGTDAGVSQPALDAGVSQPTLDAGTAPAPVVTVGVSPATAQLQAGGTQQFSASVTGSTDTRVAWSVTGAGTVSATGLYTAPVTAGTYEVVATSVADGTRSARAAVVVSAASTCLDACPSPRGGVVWGCEKRFMYGTNWAWRTWAGDFGGMAAWSAPGVSGARAAYSADLAALKAAGANVIRWWMFPRLATQAISYGADDAPSGIGGTLVADIQAALELAEQHDVYIMLTPFSFDNFAPTRTENGIYIRGLQPILVDAARRKKLVDNLLVPIARAVEASPYKKRMIAWDVINEPEWAMSGANLNGGDGFTPTAGLQSLTHAQMKTFLDEALPALRANSSALVTVGSAAIKWASAWKTVDLDFYQFHYYDWVYEWYAPQQLSLATLGLTKPVVAGEFPLQGVSAFPARGLPALSAAQFSAELWKAGWAGALSWAYNDPAFTWRPADVKTFADQHVCETAY